MDQRSKILAGILGGLVVVWGGWKFASQWVIAPIVEKKSQIAAQEKSIEKQRDELFQIMQLEKKLKEWAAQSLPPNEIDAQRLYKDWLTAIAEIIGFNDLEMSPGRRQKMMIGKGRQKKTLASSSLITLKGKTTFSRLTRFLYTLHRAKILHRVTNLQISCDDNEGDPLLDVRLTAEAISLVKAPLRKRLFAETELVKPFRSSGHGSSGHEMSVNSVAGFPTEGEFSIRIGAELFSVTQQKKSQPNNYLWTVRSGIEPKKVALKSGISKRGTQKIYPKGTRVELLPLQLPGDKPFQIYHRDLLAAGKSPFVLPVPPIIYRPKLHGLDSRSITRDQSLKTRVKAVELNPQQGAVNYQIGATNLKNRQAISLESQTGELRWKPEKTDALGSYFVEILVHQGSQKKPVLKGRLRITLQDPNYAPVLTAIQKQAVMTGQELKFQAKATDRNLKDRLSFKLSKAPEGASLDSSTGRFAWTPSDSTEPGEYQFQIVVTDNHSAKPRTDSQTVDVTVREDKTQYLYFVGAVATDGERSAWLYDISTRERLMVKEGEPFEIAGISGFMFIVGDNFCEFQSNGKTWRVRIGDSFAKKE